MKPEPGFEMEVPMWSAGQVDSLVHRRWSQSQRKYLRQPHQLYTCELDPDNPCDEGIMGTGRLFLLTAGSGGPDVCGAMSRAGGGGRGTARFLFAGGMGPDRWLRIPWATLSMSSTVVCMASAISSLARDTKSRSLAREARPPLTRAWSRRTNLSAASGVNHDARVRSQSRLLSHLLDEAVGSRTGALTLAVAAVGHIRKLQRESLCPSLV